MRIVWLVLAGMSAAFTAGFMLRFVPLTPTAAMLVFALAVVSTAGFFALAKPVNLRQAQDEKMALNQARRLLRQSQSTDSSRGRTHWQGR